MRYLADLLTLTRLILATTLLVLDITGTTAEVALIIFIIAELTDAFDGTCSRKWPFPKNKTPKYRKYAAKFDMFADIILIGAQDLFVINHVNQTVGLIIATYYLASSILGDLLVYGKPLGHPDDFTKHSLMSKNFPLAKKIILARRYILVTCIGIVSIITLFATSWSTTVKYAVLALGILIAIFLWFFLSERRHHISRDAIDIETKLTKKESKSSGNKK